MGSVHNACMICRFEYCRSCLVLVVFICLVAHVDTDLFIICFRCCLCCVSLPGVMIPLFLILSCMCLNCLRPFPFRCLFIDLVVILCVFVVSVRFWYSQHDAPQRLCKTHESYRKICTLRSELPHLEVQRGPPHDLSKKVQHEQDLSLFLKGFLTQVRNSFPPPPNGASPELQEKLYFMD